VSVAVYLLEHLFTDHFYSFLSLTIFICFDLINFYLLSDSMQKMSVDSDLSGCAVVRPKQSYFSLACVYFLYSAFQQRSRNKSKLKQTNKKVAYGG